MSIIPKAIKDILDKSFEPNSELIYVRAPGRINLIGEHTDYNKGLVLPAAIDKYVYLACVPNKTCQINASALDKQEVISLDLSNLGKTKYLWADFLIGILLELRKISIEPKGFDCAFISEVPIGAGMSSSSAIECAFLVGLQEVLGSNLDKWQLVKVSQASNHKFLGINGGIMDQFASLFGKSGKIMLLDCDTLKFNYVSSTPSDYSWLLINTCVKHNHISSGYNDRVRECAEALSDIQKIFSNIRHLSDLDDLNALDGIPFSSNKSKKRVQYIVSENLRVQAFVEYLEAEDYKSCGELMYASHLGLSMDYEVSCKELDYLVELLREESAVLGSRMMGGGFGGCTINLIHKKAVASIKEKVEASYKSAFRINPEFYSVTISEGAMVLDNNV